MEPAVSQDIEDFLKFLSDYRQLSAQAYGSSHSDGISADGDAQKCRAEIPLLSKHHLEITERNHAYGRDASIHLAELDTYQLDSFKLEDVDRASFGHLLQPVAVKEFGCNIHPSYQSRSRRQLLREARVFAKLGHCRAVPGVYGLVCEDGCYQLVLELCQCNWWDNNERGLMEVYHGKPPSSLAEVDIPFFKSQLLCAQDAAAALHLLHHKGLLHCDVKPANFLVARERAPQPGWGGQYDSSQELGQASDDHRTLLKVTDFARVQEEHQSSNRYPWHDGSLISDAPEVYQPVLKYMKTGRFEEAFLTDRSDVFALGVTIAMILTFEESFFPSELTPGQQAQARSQGEYLPTNLGCIPNCLWTVLEKCFAELPEKRPTMSELLLSLVDAVDDAVEEIEAAQGRTQAATGSSASSSLGSQLVTQEAAAEAAPAAQPVQQLAMTQISAGGSVGSRGQQQQHGLQAPGSTAADGDSKQGDGTPPVAAAAGAAAVRAAETADATTLDGVSQMLGGLRLDAAATTAAAGGQLLCQLAMADASDWRLTRRSGEQQQQHDSTGGQLAAIASAASGSDHDQGAPSAPMAAPADPSAATAANTSEPVASNLHTCVPPPITSTACQQLAAVQVVEDAEQHPVTAEVLLEVAAAAAANTEVGAVVVEPHLWPSSRAAAAPGSVEGGASAADASAASGSSAAADLAEARGSTAAESAAPETAKPPPTGKSGKARGRRHDKRQPPEYDKDSWEAYVGIKDQLIDVQAPIELIKCPQTLSNTATTTRYFRLKH